MKNKSLIIPFVEVLSKIISFFNVLLFVRILNINDYADYSYIIAIVLWSSVVMDGGINNLIYNKSLKNKIDGINELFTSRLFLSLTIIVFICLFFAYKSPSLIIPALIFSFVTYFSSTSALVKMLSRGLSFIRVDLVSIISEPLLRFIFLSIIYITKNNFTYSLWHVLLIYLIAGLIAFSINKYYLNLRFYLKTSISSVQSVFANIINSLKQSKYYLLYYIMFVGLARIDILFLESYSDKIQLAIFSTALNIYQVAQLFFISIITSQFIKIYSNKYLVLKILVPILIIAIVGTNFMSSFIYEYLFPLGYLNGQFVLNILIIALLPFIINYYYIIRNNYENRVRDNFIILSIVFLIKVIAYLILKPSDILMYSYIIIIIELVLFLIFTLKLKYESITNKQIS